MECGECHEPLSATATKRGKVFRCKGCQYIWTPRDEESPEAWVKALNSPAVDCPGCEERSLQLGSVGNRGLYRCSACHGFFDGAPTQSFLVHEVAWFFAIFFGFDILTCGFS